MTTAPEAVKRGVREDSRRTADQIERRMDLSEVGRNVQCSVARFRLASDRQPVFSLVQRDWARVDGLV